MGTVCGRRGEKGQVNLRPHILVSVALVALSSGSQQGSASSKASETVTAGTESIEASPTMLAGRPDEAAFATEPGSRETAPVATEVRIANAPVVEGDSGNAFPERLQQRPSDDVDDSLEPSASFLKGGYPAPASADRLPSVTTPEPMVSQDLYVGPSRPVGHSLGSPEAKRRITALLSRKLQDGAVSNTSAFVPDNLPPLVDGEYGFERPPDIESGVPTAVLQLGDAGARTAVVVEKLHHRLSVFRTNELGHLELVKTFRAITGKDPGDKEARGDLRTPEGIYFVNGRLEDHELPAKYGRLALTLNYPNLFDKRLKKSGYGIWIHATDDPKRLQYPFDTEGCIALSNEDITELEKHITPSVTPIIITKEMTTAEPEAIEAPRHEVLRMLESWRVSWKESDLNPYIDFYSEDFRHKHMNRIAWKAFKERLSQARNEIDVRISDPSVLAFENQMVLSFYQQYVSDGHADFGRKTLHLRWEGDRYRIISETWRPVQKTETALQEMRTGSHRL